MTITTKTVEPGIVSVTVNYPPVNAIPSAGWFELGDAITLGKRLALISLLNPLGFLPTVKKRRDICRQAPRKLLFPRRLRAM